MAFWIIRTGHTQVDTHRQDFQSESAARNAFENDKKRASAWGWWRLTLHDGTGAPAAEWIDTRRAPKGAKLAFD